MNAGITLSHRLILPNDSNHHGTLYAGSLLRIALEAAYATANRVVGREANLLLRRVLSVECRRPVPVGSIIEIQGAALHAETAYLVIGLVGSPLQPGMDCWMDGLMGFVQIDAQGRPAPLPAAVEANVPSGEAWSELGDRLTGLLRTR